MDHVQHRADEKSDYDYEDDPVQEATQPLSPLGFAPGFLPETLKVVVQRPFHLGFITQLDGQPMRMKLTPCGRDLCQGVSGCVLESVVCPERGGFRGPDSGDAVVMCHGLRPGPQ